MASSLVNGWTCASTLEVVGTITPCLWVYAHWWGGVSYSVTPNLGLCVIIVPQPPTIKASCWYSLHGPRIWVLRQKHLCVLYPCHCLHDGVPKENLQPQCFSPSYHEIIHQFLKQFPFWFMWFWALDVTIRSLWYIYHQLYATSIVSLCHFMEPIHINHLLWYSTESDPLAMVLKVVFSEST